MNYSPDVIKKAYQEISNRRDKAIAIQNAHIEDVKENLPEVYSAYLGIAKTADRLAEAIFSKSGDVQFIIENIKIQNIESQARLEKMLVNFGKPTDYLGINHTCKLCNDTGTVGGIRCQCVTELLNKYMVEKLNEQCKIKLHCFAEYAPEYYPESIIYNGVNVDSRKIMHDNLNYLINYTKSFSKNSAGIFMMGKTGLGKTFLSSCVANELINKGFSVAFDSVQNYLRDIEKEHFGKANGDTLETLLNADLLILDDLGSEFASSFNDSVIYNLINSRNNAGMPTIISTNLSLDELTSRYDDRITSRLMGAHYPMRFIGEDIRQQKRRNGEF